MATRGPEERGSSRHRAEPRAQRLIGCNLKTGFMNHTFPDGVSCRGMRLTKLKDGREGDANLVCCWWRARHRPRARAHARRRAIGQIPDTDARYNFSPDRFLNHSPNLAHDSPRTRYQTSSRTQPVLHTPAIIPRLLSSLPNRFFPAPWRRAGGPPLPSLSPVPQTPSNPAVTLIGMQPIELAHSRLLQGKKSWKGKTE